MFLIFRFFHRSLLQFPDMNKLSECQSEEAPSPWRKANPRKPLEDFPVSPEKSGEDLSSLNSPPNSNFKESTKLGVSQLNVSEATTASPALNRSEDTLRERREGSNVHFKIETYS